MKIVWPDGHCNRELAVMESVPVFDVQVNPCAFYA